MYERLLDKSDRPTKEALASYCGEGRERFQALNEALSARFATEQEIRFPYGNRYGWCITHRRRGKLICDVFAEAGAFTVMLRLSDRQYAAVYPALHADAQGCVDRRYPCGDGGWIHFRVLNAEQLSDITLLLNEKCG